MTPTQPQMTDERLDRLVRQLLTERAEDVAAVALPASTTAAVVASHVRRSGIADHRRMLLAAAVVLLVLAAGAIAVGSGFVRNAVEPQPTPLPVVPPPDATSPTPSDSAAAPQRVFYTDYRTTPVGETGCTEAVANRFGYCASSRIWVADADGSNARELFPESTDRRSLVDVSDAGDALVFTGLTQVNGQPINGTHFAELDPDGNVQSTRIVSDTALDEGCDGVCAEDNEFTFSPDGRRLAYVRYAREGDADYETVIAVQDVATGDVTELESTHTNATGGYNSTPRWSPDGSRILFARGSIRHTSSADHIADYATFVVNADGSDFRQLVPTELSAKEGAWSPDGGTIAFTSAVGWLGLNTGTGVRDNYNEDSDVYTLRPDGSELRRLTNFAPKRQDRGVPVQQGGHVAGWTLDGRIVFTVLAWAGDEGDSTNLPPQLWVMDADGANATQVDGSSIADLTALGCVDCPYPPRSGLEVDAFWRPTR